MTSRVGLLTWLAVAVVSAGDRPGITPRAESDYAAHSSVNGVTLAATVIPQEMVKKLFSKDLTHGYIVVEVAVYPESGGTADFGSDEFTLRVGSDPTILVAQTARSVAGGEKPKTASKNIPPQLPGNVHVYNTETIGYESGGYGRKGGVYTASSTTVGVGDRPVGPNPRDCDPTMGGDPRAGGDPRVGRNPRPCGAPYPDPQSQPPKPPKDHAGLQKELEDKALPEGRTAMPVAGYLYFVKPSTKQRSPDYQLSWYRVGGEIRLTLPPAK